MAVTQNTIDGVESKCLGQLLMGHLDIHKILEKFTDMFEIKVASDNFYVSGCCVS